MRIAVHDYAGFGFPFQLSEELSKRGHTVLHLFTRASGGPKTNFETKCNNNLQIKNINIYNVEKEKYFKRWLQERQYGKYATTRLNRWQPDVIISANTPLEAQLKIINWAHKNIVPSVFWLQDLLSVAARNVFDNYNRLLGRAVYLYFKKIETRALSKANYIVSITDDFIPILNKWKIFSDKISIIPNWGPIAQIPVKNKKNSLSVKYRIDKKFVVLHSGTLGKKQNLRLIVDTAKQLVNDDDIMFVVATDCRGKQLLIKTLAEKKLKNILILPLQTTQIYPYLLASSDVSLVTMEFSAGTYCVPSKTWSGFCAQKPSIIAVDKENLCARITQGADAGIVIPPGSVDECVKSIKILKNNKSLRIKMGRNARKYAEKNFPISKIANAFEDIIFKVLYN